MLLAIIGFILITLLPILITILLKKTPVISFITNIISLSIAIYYDKKIGNPSILNKDFTFGILSYVIVRTSAIALILSIIFFAYNSSIRNSKKPSV